MKYLLLYILLPLLSVNCYAQNFELQLKANSLLENKTIDSLNYISKHNNIKSLTTEIETSSQKLSKLGYIENRVTEQLRKNDSIYIVRLNLGIKIEFIHIHIRTNSELTKLLTATPTKDSLLLPYSEVERFLNENTIALERQGYSLVKLKLINLQRKGKNLFADLQFESDNKRQLNAIVIKHTNNLNNNNFPAGYLKQINRKYKNKTFNQDVVTKIYNEFQKFSFVSQIKYPEILFTKDSTKVYLYLENKKSNTFDGYIGFSNNENKKIVLKGYLDLALENTLKVGEQFSLYWNTDGSKQRTFNTSLELPYLFKSLIGLKAQLNIFKQDSIFQNTKTEIDISYFINHNTRTYLGYQSTVSSDIQNTNNSIITDYNNSFITTTLDYSKFNYSNLLFSKNSSLLLKTGLGKRKTNNRTQNNKTNQQIFIDLQAMHNFYLSPKNNINIKTRNYYLQSSNYLSSELYRFGGVNSIRGFAENSLSATFMTSITTEYRHIVSPNLYFHTILDYCMLQNKNEIQKTYRKNNIVGIGLGLGIQTTNGLLKLSIANGHEASKRTNFNNTIIHLSYNVKF